MDHAWEIKYLLEKSYLRTSLSGVAIEKSNREPGFESKEVLIPIGLALVVIQFVIQAFKIPTHLQESWRSPEGGKSLVWYQKYKPLGTRGFEMGRDSLEFRLPKPGEVLALDTFSLGKAAWIRSLAHQEHPGRKVELVLDFMKDSVVDNDYVLPYLHGDPNEPMHQGMYALLRTRYGMASQGGTPYYVAGNVPFSAIRNAARTGFISVTDLMYPPGYPDTSTFSKKMSWWLSKRNEYNEFFMGNYLDLIAQNVAGQGQQAGARYWIRARLSIDGRISDTYTVERECYFMMGDNRDESSDNSASPTRSTGSPTRSTGSPSRPGSDGRESES